MTTLIQLKQMVDKAVELNGEDAEVYISSFETIFIVPVNPSATILVIDLNDLKQTNSVLLHALTTVNKPTITPH